MDVIPQIPRQYNAAAAPRIAHDIWRIVRRVRESGIAT